MKKLIVMSHGNFSSVDSRHQLTVLARKQVATLADLLRELIGDASVGILSSTTSPAMETAGMLANRLAGGDQRVVDLCGPLRDDFEEHLWYKQCDEVLRRIREKSDDAEVVVLSTNPKFVGRFPRIWGMQYGFDIPLGEESPTPSARVIDVKTGVCRLIVVR